VLSEQTGVISYGDGSRCIDVFPKAWKDACLSKRSDGTLWGYGRKGEHMSSAANLGRFKEVQLPQGTIRYRELGSGESLVFIHGLLVNGDLWRKVVPPLAWHFRCIVPDLPLGSHAIALAEAADLSPTGLDHLLQTFLQRLAWREQRWSPTIPEAHSVRSS